MSTKHVLFISIKPHDLRLTARDGRILAIVPNYYPVYQEKPVVTDGQSQVFQIEAIEEELCERMDNGVKRLLLWKGEENSMSKPQDLHEVPVMSLIPLGDKGMTAKA